MVAFSLVFTAISAAWVYVGVARREALSDPFHPRREAIMAEFRKEQRALEMEREHDYPSGRRTDSAAREALSGFGILAIPGVVKKSLLRMDGLDPWLLETIVTSLERKIDEMDSAPLRRSPERGESGGGRTSSSAAKFDPNKYFVFEAIDPTMEFGDPIEITADKVKILLPVPKGYTYIKEEKAKATHFSFYKDDSEDRRMLVGVPYKMRFSSGDAMRDLHGAKSELANVLLEKADTHFSSIIARLQKRGLAIERRIEPTIEQNTSSNIALFFSCYYPEDGKEITMSYMEFFSTIDNRCIEILIFLFGTNHEDDKRFGFTWLKEVMIVNNVAGN